MRRPKGGKNRSHSKAEKLALVKRNIEGEGITSLARESGVLKSLIHKWTKQYLNGGETALENKRKPGDIYSVVDQAIHYFNYITLVRNHNRKPPIQYRIELVA